MVTLQQLIYFQELAKTEHLSNTAQSLCIAQTTLSTTISNLEKQLGVKLFDRTGRNIQLNDVGKVYLTYVNDALRALQCADKFISDYTGKTASSVSVAMTSSFVWQKLIKGFMEQFPECTIKQSECSRDSFYSLLTDHQIDFVISGTNDFPNSCFEHAVIYTDDIYLCVPKNHPLASKKTITLKEAANETFIDLPRSSSFRFFCDKMFDQAGINRQTKLECDYMLRGQLVESGIGVALMTNLSYWKQIIKAKCKYLLVTDEFAKREFSIFWNPKNPLSSSAVNFRNYVVDQYSK